MDKVVEFRIGMVEQLIEGYKENLDFYREIGMIEGVVQMMGLIVELEYWKGELEEELERIVVRQHNI